MKRVLLFASIVLGIGLLVLWAAPVKIQAQTLEETATATPCTCSVCATGKLLPMMGDFTVHIKRTGFPEIAFSYKPKDVLTQRMVLCVPSKADPHKLIPTPWITGPRISRLDIAAVIAMYNANKACFICEDDFKAAEGCNGKAIWKEVPPTGAAPRVYIKNK